MSFTDLLYNAGGKTVVNGSTFNAGKYGSLISVNSDSDDATVEMNGETFYYMDPSTGSAATSMGNFVCDNNKTTRGTAYDVVIYGGIFNVDPSTYVASGYAAQNNGDGTWTVSASNYNS